MLTYRADIINIIKFVCMLVKWMLSEDEAGTSTLQCRADSEVCLHHLITNYNDKTEC